MACYDKQMKVIKLFALLVCLVLILLVYRSYANRTSGDTSQKITGSYQPRTRTYYIAAEDVVWDYAPDAKDPYTGTNVPIQWAYPTRYQKMRYIEYTDDTFTTKKSQPPWLGILGPIIRGVEGDTIKVVFYNKAGPFRLISPTPPPKSYGMISPIRPPKPYSMHPHGLLYDKNNEGALMHINESMKGKERMASMTKGAGDEVMPGQKYTYTWHVRKEAAPGPNEGGSKIWIYHSHVDPVQDVYDGLIGPIIITSARYANSDGTPNDVSKEFVTMFMIFDQSQPGMTHEQAEGSMKYTINGYIFDNLPGLEMNKGEHVRWHLIGLGNEVDLHTPHWHANVVLDRGAYTDVVDLLPSTMKSVDMTADNAGLWMFHCHVAEHVKDGMTAMYKVK
jgi:FtsP/CotA-like multicopper oxidase with cupredoxin domain